MEKKFNLIYTLLSVLVVIILVQSYFIYDFKHSVLSVSKENMGNNSTKIAPVATTVAKDPFVSQFFNNFDAKSADPFEQMKKMQEQMQKSFGQFNSIFADDPFFKEAFERGGVSPLSDFKKNKNEYILELNLPGAKEQKIDIKSVDNRLNIRASTEISKDTNGTNYIHKERYTQNFERSFTLPKDADLSAMTNSYKNGVLKITIPKKR